MKLYVLFENVMMEDGSVITIPVSQHIQRESLQITILNNLINKIQECLIETSLEEVRNKIAGISMNLLDPSNPGSENIFDIKTIETKEGDVVTIMDDKRWDRTQYSFKEGD